MTNKRSIFAILLMCLAVLPLSGALPLAKNGKAAAVIAVPAKADKVMTYAASELQHWIKEISGAKLEIVNDAAADGAMIVLDPASANFPEDAEKFKGCRY